MYPESCLQNISFLHVNLVVTKFEIQLRKNSSSIQLIQQLIYYWDGKFIWNGHLVENSIVHTKSSALIFFLHQGNSAGKRANTRSNNSSLQHICNQPFNIIFLVVEYLYGLKFGMAAPLWHDHVFQGVMFLILENLLHMMPTIAPLSQFSRGVPILMIMNHINKEQRTLNLLPATHLSTS